MPWLFSYKFFLFWIETHRGMEQNSLWISNTQGPETTHHRYRTLWHRWSRSRIWCGHWPCLLFISQTLSETPAKQNPHPCVLFVIILSISASDLLNSSYLFPNFWKKKYNLTKKKYNLFCPSIHPVQFKCFCFIFFLPIPTSKCLNGAIINKCQHFYDNTVLHSLDSSPPAEQRSHSPAKEYLSFLNRQRWN